VAKTKARRKPARKRTRQRPAPAPPDSDASLTQSPIGDKLTDDVKLVVVQRLAMYDTPQQIADAVKEDFAIEVTRQAIHYYDPTHEPKPPEKWRDIFARTREEFLKSTADIPIANKSVRLRRLERMALAAERMKNYALAAVLHEQAAKEVGEVYTNKSKVDLNATRPITGVTVEIHNGEGPPTTETLT
jgi:hypothetical protein